jgi:arylsulfatase A-like enzyme
VDGEPGTLADVAPTVLAIMGLSQPEGEFVRGGSCLTAFRNDWTISARQKIDYLVDKDAPSVASSYPVQVDRMKFRSMLFVIVIGSATSMQYSCRYRYSRI